MIHVLRVLLALSLASCAPCRSKQTPPVPEGSHFRRVTIMNFGLERPIPLSADEAATLARLLADCRECIPEYPPGMMVSPDMRYVVRFQAGPKPEIWDPAVVFSSDRSPLHLRCGHAGTGDAMKRLLAKHMDELDAEVRAQKPTY